MIVNNLYLLNRNIGISLVKYPAIESNFIALNSDVNKISFNSFQMFSDNGHNIIEGALLIPDIPIVRKASDDSIYYINFTQTSINDIFSTLLYNSPYYNIEHLNDISISDITTAVFYIENKEINRLKVPIGSLIIRLTINNDDIWNKIKTSNLRGFSIESDFLQVSDPKEIEEIETTLTLDIAKKLTKKYN